MAGEKYLSDGRPAGVFLGQSSTDKIGFYGTTPIVQRSGSAQDAVSTTLGAVSSTAGATYGFPTAAQADAHTTLLNECRAALVALGLIKGSS
jgi:hypothetical protein